MKRIIVHWTAGTYNVSDLDREHYHYIIDGNGKAVDGKWRPEANLSTKDGEYAAHTRGCNTGSIGVSMACMAGAKENPFNPGKYPLKELQWDRMIQLVAYLAKLYKIPVTPQTILTHAEVQGTLGIAQKGKWDITRLPFDPKTVGAKAVGNKMRAQIAALNAPKPQKPPVQPVPAPKPPVAPKPVSPPVAAPAPSLWARLKALFRKGAK